jgi:7-carboxy-7-deazaguanine synthase
MSINIPISSIVNRKTTVQNVDRNVGPGEYKHLKEDELLITSYFYTLQGEGPYAGMTSVFVRLAGCNFGGKGVNGAGCEFCDTKFFYNQGKIMSFSSILEKVNELSENKKKTDLIVITGGEPMLQANVSKFSEFLNNNGYNTQFETNGSFIRNIAREHNGCKNTIVCSPKMGGATSYPTLRKDVFDRADVLKFVVEEEGKFSYIPEYVWEFSKKESTQGNKVYVSPINVYLRPVKDGEVPNFFDRTLFNYEECQKNYTKAAKLCLDNNFTLNIQKHLFVNIE